MTKRAAWGHQAPALLSEQKQSSLGAVGSIWSSHLVRASTNHGAGELTPTGQASLLISQALDPSWVQSLGGSGIRLEDGGVES